MGCPGVWGTDSITHYWECPLFGTVFRRLIGYDLPPSLLERLGILAPSPRTLEVPADAYFLFNGLRIKASRISRPLFLEEACEVVFAVRRQLRR